MAQTATKARRGVRAAQPKSALESPRSAPAEGESALWRDALRKNSRLSAGVTVRATTMEASNARI